MSSVNIFKTRNQQWKCSQSIVLYVVESISVIGNQPVELQYLANTPLFPVLLLSWVSRTLQANR